MSSAEEIVIYCAQCGRAAEETLLLTCDHNLCLQCASENITRDLNNFQNVNCSCPLCKIRTILDQATATEIISHGSKKNLGTITHSPLMNNIIHNESLNMSSISKQNLNNASIANSNLLIIKKEYCKEHGEEVTYFCFDCISRCICSECVVHGFHKNHQVMNIKKAYPVICEKSDDLICHVQNKINELSTARSSLETRKSELMNTTSLVKNEIASAFEEIRVKIAKKEKEIIDKTEMFLQENLQELSTYSRILQTKIISLNKIIDNISSNLLRKDEVNLLNFYADNATIVLKNSEISDIPNLPELNTLNSMKVTINPNSLDSLINAMNALHLEITAMKGFDINKMQYNQKFTTRRNMYGLMQETPCGNSSSSVCSYDDDTKGNMNVKLSNSSKLK